MLADAQFWANYVPDRDDDRGDRGTVTRHDGRGMSADAFMGLFGAGTM